MFVSPDMTPLEIKTIPAEHVAPVVRALIERGLDPWVYQYNDWLLRDPAAPHAERESKTVQFAPIVTQDLESHADGVVKIVGVSDDHALVEACENEARERFQPQPRPSHLAGRGHCQGIRRERAA